MYVSLYYDYSFVSICSILRQSRAQWGHTALISAALRGRADCVRLLLDAGADKEAKTEARVSRFAAEMCCLMR